MGCRGLNFTIKALQGGSFRNESARYQFAIFLGQGIFDEGPDPTNTSAALRHAVTSSGGSFYAIGI